MGQDLDAHMLGVHQVTLKTVTRPWSHQFASSSSLASPPASEWPHTFAHAATLAQKARPPSERCPFFKLPLAYTWPMGSA